MASRTCFGKRLRYRWRSSADAETTSWPSCPSLGLTFFIWSLRRFAVEGKGTLAPWDPPRDLVVQGPYRYVRNPMISGVLLILLGETALLRSSPHLVWTAVFFGLNAVWIPLVEEPQLAERFGAKYRDYCRNVPRVIPRLTPWNQ